MTLSKFYIDLMLRLQTLVFLRLETVNSELQKTAVSVNSGSKSFPWFRNEAQQNWTLLKKKNELLFQDKGRLHDELTVDLYLTYFFRPPAVLRHSVLYSRYPPEMWLHMAHIDQFLTENVDSPCVSKLYM